MSVQTGLLHLQLFLLMTVFLCLFLRLVSGGELGAFAAGEDVKDDGLRCDSY